VVRAREAIRQIPMLLAERGDVSHGGVGGGGAEEGPQPPARRPQSFVSKCESGKRRVDALELTEFARLYKKELTYLMK